MARKKRSQNRELVTHVTSIISRCLESWRATARLCLVLACFIFATIMTITVMEYLQPITGLQHLLPQGSLELRHAETRRSVIPLGPRKYIVRFSPGTD
jgi:hypothetical protein